MDGPKSTDLDMVEMKSDAAQYLQHWDTSDEKKFDE